MNIYTKRGDGGETSLFGGERLSKSALRVQAYGTVDELNALLGVVREAVERDLPEIGELILRIQHDCFVIGADLASPNASIKEKRASMHVDDRFVTWLEEHIDRYTAELPPMKQFILPGGTRPAALLHWARTVARRAEREVVALSTTAGEDVNPAIIRYLNRLSDLLFVMARLANARADRTDVPWQQERP